MLANPATPKTIQRVGNSGDSGYDAGGTAVVVGTGFVRTAVGVTGRVAALVVDSAFICWVMVTSEISVGVVVGTPFLSASRQNTETRTLLHCNSTVRWYTSPCG